MYVVMVCLHECCDDMYVCCNGMYVRMCVSIHVCVPQPNATNKRVQGLEEQLSLPTATNLLDCTLEGPPFLVRLCIEITPPDLY